MDNLFQIKHSGELRPDASEDQKDMTHQQVALSRVFAAIALLLAGCGGGDTDSDTSIVTGPTSTLAAADSGPSPATMEPVSTGLVRPMAVSTATATDGAALLRITDDSNGSTNGVALIAEPQGLPPVAPIPTAASAGSTYYIDSVAGNDTAAGSSASSAWKTLARLTRASLKPGDQIYLVCGSQWNETLSLPASGTSASPIAVTAYPSDCSKSPVIDGATPIDSNAWKVEKGAIHTAPFVALGPQSVNLMNNGGLDTSLSGWGFWSAAKDGTGVITKDCAYGDCATLTRSTTQTILYSNPFPLVANGTYGIRYRFKAAVGTKLRVTVKRAVSPFERQGHDVILTGTGRWETITASFVAPLTLAQARLDVELLSPSSVVQVDDFMLAQSTSNDPEITQIIQPGDTLQPAHHPNLGYAPLEPDSIYLKIAGNSPVVASGGSTVMSYGRDLLFPAGASLSTDTVIRVRQNAWAMEDMQLASFTANRMTFTSSTRYPLELGWGYFLLNQKWMLDSAGEWFHDKANSSIHVWMTDSRWPGARISVVTQKYGVNLAGLSHVHLSGLIIRNVDTGVNIRNTTGVGIYNSTIENTTTAGVDALASINARLVSNVIRRSRVDAITGGNATGVPANGMYVAQNLITESGVIMNGDKVVSLPIKSNAAIRSGDNSVVTNNVIRDTGFLGIHTYGGGQVYGNYIYGACSVLDDCAGIYTSAKGNNGVIRENIVVHSRGNTLGKTPLLPLKTYGQGIYLDELATGVTVSNNIVVDGDNGVQLHVSANNVISGNTLFGNRQSQLWLQNTGTRTATTGDVYGNLVTLNKMAAINPAALLVKQSTTLSNTDQFASYQQNTYFDLASLWFSAETLGATTKQYNFSTWRKLRAASGSPRSLDATSWSTDKLPYALYVMAGTSLIKNGNFANDISDWTAWNQTAPAGILEWQTCATGRCLTYTAGGSAGVISSSSFSISSGTWYRVSFDISTNGTSTPVTALVRRGGGGKNGYESLQGDSGYWLNATSTVQRISYLFQATADVNANNPVTLDKGARLDFQGILTGSTIRVANVEVIPLKVLPMLSRSDMLLNATDRYVSFDCPQASSAPAECARYAPLGTAEVVIWPVIVPPRSAQIMFMLDRSYPDSDGDGITDQEDHCPSTRSAAVVNSTGCAVNQMPAW